MVEKFMNIQKIDFFIIKCIIKMINKFKKHQQDTQSKDFDINYLTIGLCGEIGEFANEIKKLMRDDNNRMTKERRKKIILELGDVMWYYFAILNKLNIKFDNVLRNNINKLN